MEEHSPFQGRCHCGAVRFEVRMDPGFSSALRCNCSYCAMRGAVAVTARQADFRLLQGAETLTAYQFNTREARHFFCSVCGIYTHHQRRSDPAQLGINVACLEGRSPFDFAVVPVVDGQNHPKDNGGGKSRLAGHLRYEKVSS